MTKGHSSYFSYNISRQYPFRWFTPIAIVGAIILTTLFSVLNFATNGYVLGSKFVADPNSTLAQKTWFEKPPFSYQSKLSASCEVASIQLGTILVAKSGFQYQLDNVWIVDETGASTNLPSLTYLNNSFASCDFTGVQVILKNNDPEANGPFWTWTEDSSAVGYVTCTIDNAPLPTYLNLSVSLNFNLQGSPPDVNFGFLKAKRQTQASLWFGQLLMWLNFYYMENQVGMVDINSAGLLKRVTVYVVRNPSQQDILQDDFLDFTTNATGSGHHSTASWDSSYGIAGGEVVAFPPGPLRGLQIANTNIGEAIDDFAKSIYSFLMADLGQLSQPSVLGDQDTLQSFWKYCEIFVTESGQNAPIYILPDGAGNFDLLKETTGPIALSPTTLNAEYLCQIPRRKDTTSIIIAIIVADLVLLQAAWNIFTWITTFGLEKKHPNANFCLGCAQHLGTSSSQAAQHSDTGLVGESYKMNKSGIVGPRTARYAKLSQVQVGDVSDRGSRTGSR